MTLKAGLDRLKAEISKLEAAIGKADPAPVILDIANDPERAHAGPDEAMIGGQVYVRGEDEDPGDFDARLRKAATAAGEKTVLVSLADFGPGPFLDGYRIGDLDLRTTYEIGDPAPR